MTTWIRTEAIFPGRVEETSFEIPDTENVTIRRGLLERLLAEAGYSPGPALPETAT